MFGAIRRDMKVIGRTIKCMEMEEFNGLMVELMKVNSSMIENMAMEHFVGLMVVSIEEDGNKVNNMVKDNITWNVERKEQENGWMVKG